MEIRVVDFDILTRNFQPYIDGYKNIELEKKALIESIQPMRKEIEALLTSANSGLIVNEAIQRQNAERFKVLQDKLMRADGDFKRKLKGMQDDLNTSVYEQLSDIISERSKENSIDLVMGKMEIVFSTKNVEVTDQILEIIKTKNLLYNPLIEAETQKES